MLFCEILGLTFCLELAREAVGLVGRWNVDDVSINGDVFLSASENDASENLRPSVAAELGSLSCKMASSSSSGIASSPSFSSSSSSSPEGLDAVSTEEAFDLDPVRDFDVLAPGYLQSLLPLRHP